MACGAASLTAGRICRLAIGSAKRSSSRRRRARRATGDPTIGRSRISRRPNVTPMTRSAYSGWCCAARRGHWVLHQQLPDRPRPPGVPEGRSQSSARERRDLSRAGAGASGALPRDPGDGLVPAEVVPRHRPGPLRARGLQPALLGLWGPLPRCRRMAARPGVPGPPSGQEGGGDGGIAGSSSLPRPKANKRYTPPA